MRILKKSSRPTFRRPKRWSAPYLDSFFFAISISFPPVVCWKKNGILQIKNSGSDCEQTDTHIEASTTTARGDSWIIRVWPYRTCKLGLLIKPAMSEREDGVSLFTLHLGHAGVDKKR